MCRSHLLVAKCDVSGFVEHDLEGEGSLGLHARESDLLPLDHKHLA